MMGLWMFQTGSEDPFFSNDLAGLAKVVGVFGGMLIAVVGAVWKIMRGPIQASVKEVSDAHTDTAKTVSDLGARTSSLEREVSNLRAEQGYFRENLGRLEGMLESSLRDAKTDREARERDQRQILQRLTSIETAQRIYGMVIGAKVKLESLTGDED